MTARVPLVQTATLRLAAGQDEAAPGASVTAALCGHWEHNGPCRWPHHTSHRRSDGDLLDVRVVAVADPEDVASVRALVFRALSTGQLDGPPGIARWQMVDSAAGELVHDEHDLVERLGAG